MNSNLHTSAMCDVHGEWKTLEDWIYSNSVTTADSACASNCDKLYFPVVDAWKITPVACIEGAQIIDCSAWRPNLFINDGDTVDQFYVSRELVETLTRDPEPLVSCDDATLVQTSRGGYVVMNSSPDEMLYELGLRNGDTVQALNGYPLNTPEDVAVAYTQLWSNGESEFILDLERDNTRIQLYYLLVE